ncbi:30S ribosomal protein S2 [Candidatus Dojkabacteria bacterium]|nr:30S ribosomal protein S2 [Candidatus Dojkabacteria bacterium]
MAESTAKEAVKASKKISKSSRPSNFVRKPEEVKSVDLSKIKDVTLQELLAAGCHFGHKKSRWNPAMKDYVFDVRNNMHIIDLTQTLKLMREAAEFLAKISTQGNILLVGTKGQAATLIKNAGIDHGAFYISKKWPAGLLTNSRSIQKSINKLMFLDENLAAHSGYETKRERGVMDRDRERYEKVYEGVTFMDKKPVAMFVIDTKFERIAIKEARKMNIPLVAIVDTNCDPKVIDYPIPGNDDAIKSLRLFIDYLAQAFSDSKPSRDLIKRRNDYISNIEAKRQFSEKEQERKRMEQELHVQKLKAMKDGVDVAESDATSGKVVRIVQADTSSSKTSGKVEDSKKSVKKVVKKMATMNEEKVTDINELKLPKRTLNALKESNIKTVDELRSKTKSELLGLKGVGEKAIEDINKALKK